MVLLTDVHIAELKITAVARGHFLCNFLQYGHAKFDHDCIKLCTDGQSKFSV